MPFKKFIEGRDAGFWILLLLAAVFFVYRYSIDPLRPGVNTPIGWYFMSDQKSYLRMVRELAQGHLERFPYGLGYPAMAVPAYWLGVKSDPFLPFNTLAFAGTIGATYLVGKRAFSAAVGAIAALLLLFASPLVDYTLVPWSSTVSLLGLGVVLLMATSEKLSPWHAAVSGAILGLVFEARYIDALWLAPIVLAGILRHQQKLKLAILAGVAALVVAIPSLAAHQAFFGSIFKTPYTLHVPPGGVGPSDQDPAAYRMSRIPKAAAGVFVSPFRDGRREPGTPLLASMFWAIAAIPGAFTIRRTRDRSALITSTLAGLASTLFYLSFRATGPGALQFGGLHYFKTFWPLWALLAANAIFLTWQWLLSRTKFPNRLAPRSSP